MDFGWVAIALGDVFWIFMAFGLGFLAHLAGLPPLVGFLATGFALGHFGVTSGETLQKLADLGITLLLFTVGLKLNLHVLARPQVWAVTVLHIGIVLAVFTVSIFALALLAIPMYAGLSLEHSLLLGFALSFSSTVFVVKALEEKGEMKSLHGRIAIGILIMQDVAAVIFLALSTGKLPSLWAPLLVLLILVRPLFHYLLERTGHGELLVLYGLVLALGGAELFELLGVKGDLGALVMGLLVSTHVRSNEMARAMLGFKDLFLLGFFLTIGMSGQLSVEILLMAIWLVPFIFVKSAAFFGLLMLFRLRARTALLASLHLTNYSEFGLIVAAIGVANGWLGNEWLVVLSLAVALSFVVAAPFIDREDRIYSMYGKFWRRFQHAQRLSFDQPLDVRGATIAIFGMGRVGRGAYKRMRELHGDTVVGVDFDDERVARYGKQGFNIQRGDPGDADFWDNLDKDHGIELVMLALPSIEVNLDVLEELRASSFKGRVAAVARWPEEEEQLLNAGATAVFNVYTEAGAGFADCVAQNLDAMSKVGERPDTP